MKIISNKYCFHFSAFSSKFVEDKVKNEQKSKLAPPPQYSAVCGFFIT